VAAPSVGSEVIGASIVGIVSLMSKAAASPDGNVKIVSASLRGTMGFLICG
jgi:hypothetical protein